MFIVLIFNCFSQDIVNDTKPKLVLTDKKDLSNNDCNYKYLYTPLHPVKYEDDTTKKYNIVFSVFAFDSLNIDSTIFSAFIPQLKSYKEATLNICSEEISYINEFDSVNWEKEYKYWQLFGKDNKLNDGHFCGCDSILRFRYKNLSNLFENSDTLKIYFLIASKNNDNKYTPENHKFAGPIIFIRKKNINTFSSVYSIAIPLTFILVICVLAFVIVKLPLKTSKFKAINQSIIFSILLIFGSIINLYINIVFNNFHIHPYASIVFFISGMFLLCSSIIVLIEKKNKSV